MSIVFEGCCHGELDEIYDQIKQLNTNVGLVLIGGDFQAVRNEQDLNCMSVPVKYRRLADFHQYYSGAKVAPFLTVIIGGNHEASNYLDELPYGGWVAPNIYYLGRVGVVKFQGVRIAGLSGVYKQYDYNTPYAPFTLPYDRKTISSMYHIRHNDVQLLDKITGKIEVVMSHDWPCGVVEYGDKPGLLKRKRHLTSDVESKTLGSPPAMELLKKLRPWYWLSAHLHVKFEATVGHAGKVNEDEIDLDLDDDGEDENEDKYDQTNFLALDKCLPNHQFIQQLSIPSQAKRKRDAEEEEEADTKPQQLEYDPEWLAIIRANKTGKSIDEERQWVNSNIDLTVPNNFTPTLGTQDQLQSDPNYHQLVRQQPPQFTNPQTTQFLDLLGLSS